MEWVVCFLGTAALAWAAAQAGQVTSFAELEAILIDQLILEDFEGISLHGGSSFIAPNPMNAGNVGWGLEPGITYAADETLRYRNPQDDIVLEATGTAPNEMTLTFDQPQSAVGFTLINANQPETVVFYSDTVVLSSIAASAAEYSQFIGWHAAAGITSVSIGANATVTIDDMAWGAHEPGTFPLPAPDGRDQTTPMVAWPLTPNGDELRTTWDVSSCPSADYNLLYGRLADVATYTIAGSECGTGAGGVIDWVPALDDDLFFLIVGINDAGDGESSWGTDSAGGERNETAPSGQCGVTEKDLFGVCL